MNRRELISEFQSVCLCVTGPEPATNRNKPCMQEATYFPPPETKNGAEIVISAPLLHPDSETFQHIRHQLTRKIAAQPIQRCRILLQKGGQVCGGLILLAKNVVAILVKHFAVAAVQSD